MKIVHTIALVLLIIGGINWGLLGLLNFDLVSTLFGDFSQITRTIYTIVGVSAVVVAITSVMKAA